VTENPNPQPDPNAGPPPGGPVGRPAQPEPTPPAAEQPAEAGEAAASAASSEPEAAGTQASAGGVSEPWAAEPESEPEHETEAEYSGPVDPNAPSTGLAATFLPGIDAASILALIVGLLGAGAYLLVNPLVQANDAARTWSDFKNNVPRTRQDPFGVQRDWVSYQSWAQIILGLVAVLLALLVLALWTARRNRLASRAVAQAALVLGLAVLLYGILLKTGAVGSQIPSLKTIQAGLSAAQ
jgi:hypothetical protein